ncbi:MAG: 16S rRNA (adenine(1518)-N(6)/adenine(1519)-N(6))-dimethyltransferase RsmA [Bacillota bacterium]|nr:16S rRNA (adenine(1518)-N(6)/adenine(1519)-N(6))-dimethyltransferase RsmA [Bacillota bacterium]
MKEFSLETRIKVLMNQYDFRFQKSLGQNFLIDESALSEIVDGAHVTKDDKVLEIGPGMGFLTEKLAEAAGLVIAVELDQTLCEILTKLFAEDENILIHHGDALRLDFGAVSAEGEARGFIESFKIVANLPYYITTPLIFYFLEHREYWSEMVLMVQKEVAQRIAASAATKDYGVLTLMVQYDADSEVILNVPAASFHPRPAVDSAVIRLTKRDAPPFPVTDRNKFQSLVKAGFGQRRKTLNNALANGGLGLSKEQIARLLTECEIDGKRRGETLTFEEYACLANAWAFGSGN